MIRYEPSARVRRVALPMLVALGSAVAVRAQPPSPVVVAPVVRANVGASQTYLGTVEPAKRAIVGSAVDGRVSEFPLNAGDRIEEGGTLAQVLTQTIELEKQAAEAEWLLAREELAELKNGTRPEELRRAAAEMESAASTEALARSNLERSENLFRGGTITQAILDSARSAARVAAQDLAERRAAHELAVAGPRKETIDQAAARVSMHEAMVGKLEDQIKKHTIISRFAGYVVMEYTEVGSWVKRGDPVAEVAALDEVDVVAAVLESHVPFVRKGMAVRVEIPSLPDRLVTGEVVQVVPQADLRARTFPVKIRVANEIGEEGPAIKAGMLARVHLPTGAVRESLLVPKDAIVLGGRSPLVFVVDRASTSESTGTVRPVPVTLGVASGGSIAVEGELEAGQEVVVRGNERVRPGQAVNVISVESAPDAEKATDAEKPANSAAPPIDAAPAGPGSEAAAAVRP